MPKTTEQLLASKAGETAESNGFGSQERPLRPSGVYELKNDDGDVVDRLIVKTHPKFGDSQAAAVERVGYRFVREAKKDEVKAIEVDVKALATEGTDSETTKGIQARLSALEAESKQKDETIAALRAEQNSGSADGDTKANAKEEASEEAQARVKARGEGLTGAEETQRTEELKAAGDPLENGDEGDDEDDDEDGEKPLNRQNRVDLEATAEKEGVELTEAENTNAKIAEKIQKSRDEKEGK